MAAKAQPEQQQQQNIVREEGGVGGSRVLMTIELEMTRKDGGGAGGRSEPLSLFSRLANQLTFK